jgi:hypothetical protein
MPVSRRGDKYDISTSCKFQCLADDVCGICRKGRWIDNVFVERLWKSVKCEHVYLHAYDSVSEARQQLTRYFAFYNARRPHSSLGGNDPGHGILREPGDEKRSMMLNHVSHCAAPWDNLQPQERHLINQRNCPNKRGHLFSTVCRTYMTSDGVLQQITWGLNGIRSLR